MFKRRERIGVTARRQDGVPLPLTMCPLHRLEIYVAKSFGGVRPAPVVLTHAWRFRDALSHERGSGR